MTKVVRPVEDDIIGTSATKPNSKDPVPESLLVPINGGNVYLTILLGAAVMKSGLSGICQGHGKFPPKCFVNPKTVYDLKPTSRRFLDDTYEFDETLPDEFNEVFTLNGHFFGTSVWIDICPDESLKEGYIEFCCRLV